MRIDVLTLFPAMFDAVLSTSILGRAAQAGRVEFGVHDIRAWTEDKHGKADDRPFGGGPGMVMTCQPIYDAVNAVEALGTAAPRRVLLSPQGERLEQRRVEELAREPRLLLIAGHYEGIDERLIDELEPLEISVGDYVLTGGELPAMVLIDAVVRLVPGVLGHAESAASDSFVERALESGGRGRLLEGPQYTRPAEWHGRATPDVLLSGDHAAVHRWRLERMIERTRKRRPDLIED